MSTAVALNAIWLNDALDPSDARAFRYVGDSYRVSPKSGGGVESGYASGRSRGYSTEDDTVQVQVTLEGLYAEDSAWLDAHRGRTLCFRDPLGRKFFVAYYESPFTVSTMPAGPGGRRQDTADLTADSVTYSEAV